MLAGSSPDLPLNPTTFREELIVISEEQASKSVISDDRQSALSKLLASVKVLRPNAPVARQGTGPTNLSAGQRSLWLTDKMDPGNSAYNVTYAFHIQGIVDVDALREAFKRVSMTHPALRTYFGEADEMPFQDIDETVDLPFEVLQVETELQVIEAFTQSANTGFSLDHAPLWRAQYIELSESDHWLLIVMHHIISDGWSCGMLFQGLTNEYASVKTGGNPAIPPKLDYLDFSEWQKALLDKGVLDDQREYWRTQMEGVELTQLVSDRPLPPQYTFNGSTETVAGVGSLSDIRAIAKNHGVSEFIAYCAILSATLSHYVQSEDVIFGIPTANRNYEELEDIFGYFVNVVPLRFKNQIDHPLSQHVARTKEVIQSALSNADLPIEEIVNVAQIRRDASRSGIFQIGMTVVQEGPRSAERPEHADFIADSFYLESNTARYQLSWQFVEKEDDINILLEYSSDLFDPTSAREMAKSFITVARACNVKTDPNLSEISLMSEHERDEEIARGIGVVTTLDERDIYSAFSDAASISPNNPAVFDENGPTSYAELQYMAEAFAAELHAQGISRGDRVALLSHRTAHLPAAVLSILRCGATYVPLDPGNPVERNSEIVRDSAARVIMVPPELLSNLEDTDSDSVRLVMPPRDVRLFDAPLEDNFHYRPSNPDDAAYLMYTSGSTGKPKGVLVPHKGVTNFIANVRELFDIGTEDRFLGYASVGFDVSIFEMFGPILAGASVDYIRTEDRLDLDALGSFITSHRITVTDLPPSVMSLLDPAGFSDLRIVFVGGESFSSELVAAWAPGRRFFNGYGPTECTVTMIINECLPKSSAHTPPIGHPMANHVAHVLDHRGGIQKPGIPGELAVGGIGLAMGYNNRADAQAAVFIQNPFGTTIDDRLYMTGDIVRRNADGLLVYLGRRDGQVKISGVRIELGEVEAHLRSHHMVKQCHVLITSTEGGRKRLSAFIVATAGAEPSATEIREYLAKHLIRAMIPETVTFLSSLPLKQSGKVDVALLPDPVESTETSHEPPSSGTEKRLLDEIYLPVLEIKEMSVTEGFFDAGGSSLRAAQLLARIRKVFEVEIPLARFFSDSSPRTMARRIDRQLLARLPENELKDRLSNMSDEEASWLLEGDEG